MKLVKRESLAFREGTSDKVYEVDLCEVSAGRYTVNFRYGRRGATLKEGAKTTQPVDLANAERVFADLVGSKVKKGYRPDDGTQSSRAKQRGAKREVSPEARARAIVDRLTAAASGRDSKGWPVERVIWRAGELRLRVAAPLLVKLVGTGSPLRDYCIAWALGRCGDATAVEPLSGLFGRSNAPHVRRIAREALLALSDAPTVAEFRSDTIASLPAELADPVRERESERFADALATYLSVPEHKRFGVLDTLYLVDDEIVRPALLRSLAAAPLEPPWFRPLRHVFKAAEFRHDAEVFGILARRFETASEMYKDRYSYPGLRVVLHRPDGTWLNVLKRDALGRGNSEIAYGWRTRQYLRRRVVRTLRTLGELGDADYVKMAVGVLLAYDDGDARPPRDFAYYDFKTRQTKTRTWDAYGGYLAFNEILYAQSPRYARGRGGTGWLCTSGYTPGDPDPAEREEAFPELWDATPAGLVHLLAESRCEPVHRFAVKALRANASVLDRFDTEMIALLVGRPYEVTARLGFELAEQRYSPLAPDFGLVVAVADCWLEEARVRARDWIDADRARFFARAEFVVALALAAHADTRAFAREACVETPLVQTVARDVVARLVEFALASDASRAELAHEAGAFLLRALAGEIGTIDLATVARMLAHPLVAVQELGGRILLAHETPAEAIPDEVIRGLVNSPNPTTRALGVELVTKLADATLVERDDLLLWIVAHPHADVREAARPLVARIAERYTADDVNLMREGLPSATPAALVEAKTAFVDRFAKRLVAMLLEPEAVEGLHAHLLRTINDDLHAPLAHLTVDDAWTLLRAPSPAAQELAGLLFGGRDVWGADLPTESIVDFAFHEIRSVREAAAAILPKLLHRFQTVFSPAAAEELFKLIRVLDSPWDDMRAFWHSMFRVYFRNDYTVGHLVAICDSPREDARALGRELVGLYARPEDGLEFLTKLSEHPAGDVQLFVTSYLEGYAAGSPERLADLAYYFATVLARVSSSRVAKARILAFLASEATTSNASARVVADVLTRFSATAAVEYRAAALETMLAIHRTYPEIPLPIRVKPVEVRNAV